MTMNSKEIFEEYTQATGKTKYIKDKAKELGVAGSDIICELLKSGYKFDELRRCNKAEYNSALNKFKKWQENGSPEDEDTDALSQYDEAESNSSENAAEQAEEEKPEYEYPATDEGEPLKSNCKSEELNEDLLLIQDRTIAELKYKNEKLEVKLKSLASENVELKAENSKLEEDIKIQNGKIEALERKLIGSQAYDDVCKENEKLKKRLYCAERYIYSILFTCE